MRTEQQLAQEAEARLIGVGWCAETGAKCTFRCTPKACDLRHCGQLHGARRNGTTDMVLTTEHAQFSIRPPIGADPIEVIEQLREFFKEPGRAAPGVDEQFGRALEAIKEYVERVWAHEIDYDDE